MPIAPPPSFVESLTALQIELEPAEIDQLGQFLELLLEANKRFNLTAIRDAEQAWERHILDSLTLLPILHTFREEYDTNDQPLEIADVGSGGGLPALPLAICLPNVRFTLIEATGKKAAFLSSTIQSLGLENARVLNERSEDVGTFGSPDREQFDFVTARAVGQLKVLLELTIPLLRPRGVAALIKGQKAEEEITAAKKAAVTLHATHVHTVPTSTGRIVLYKKTGRTPRDYPRMPGEPKRMPLGSD